MTGLGGGWKRQITALGSLCGAKALADAGGDEGDILGEIRWTVYKYWGYGAHGGEGTKGDCNFRTRGWGRQEQNYLIFWNNHPPQILNPKQ